MKINRHEKILELIKLKDIETQEELAHELRENGFNVTQATVSRDIKNLQLLKVLTRKGTYKYVSPQKNSMTDFSDKLVSVFSHTVISVEQIDNFVIVKTLSGSAPAAAEALDVLGLNEVAGTIAGDNTIFILARSNDMAETIVERINEIIE